MSERPALGQASVTIERPTKESPDFPTEFPPAHRLHVFQRLRMLSGVFELEDPYWTEIITAQEFIAAAEHYKVEREVAHALRVDGTSYARVVRDGLFRRLFNYLSDYDTVDKEPGRERRALDTTDPIVVGELHCPAVHGASATFENTTTQGTRLGVEITAGGVGGGGWSRERVYSEETRFSIKARHCALLCVHLRGHYVIWEHLRTKDRMVLVNVTGVHRLFPMPLDDVARYAEDHLCPRPDTYDRFWAELDSGYADDKVLERIPVLKSGGGEDTFDAGSMWETTREYVGRWGFEARHDGVPLGSGGVVLTSRFIDKIKVTLKCPYGYNYLGRYRSARELPQQWAANAVPAAEG